MLASSTQHCRSGQDVCVCVCVVYTQVVDAVNALEDQRQMLSELQATAGLGVWNDALLLDLRLAGVVEAWAAGATWKQVRW